MFEQRVDNIVGIAYAMDLLDYVPKVCAFLVFFQLKSTSVCLLISYNNLIVCRINVLF